MPTDHDASNMRTAPSTTTDGLDLTVEEARKMPAEEFCRVFGLRSLDDVPLVAPGHLTRAPRPCEWYVRHRPADKDPGPKGRKTPGYELVVKVPQHAAPEAAMCVNPRRIGLQAKDADGARLEALVFLARKSGRRRRATNWPIERIQGLLVRDVLEVYKKVFIRVPLEGEDKLEDAVKIKVRRTYGYAINAFIAALPELEVGDVVDGLLEKYLACRSDRNRSTRLRDLYTVRRSLKLGLQELGVPPTYNVHFRIPDPGMTQKTVWTVDEYDRLCAAADGYLFEPGGAPKMVPGPDGPVQMRRMDSWTWESRDAWRRAIPFLAYTASRHGRLARTRWVPPEAEPMDGKRLPKLDRPWLEVLEDRIFYHRDGEARCDSNKRRGGNMIPKEFEPTVRAWYEADLARGYEFVFHKRDGSRYSSGRELCRETFKHIVEDAGIDPDRVPHHLKDLAVDWSDEAGVDRETLAVHADTTAQTLDRKYGNARRTALLERAADEITQDAWRVRGTRKANVTKLFRKARTESMAAGEGPAPTRRLAKR